MSRRHTQILVQTESANDVVAAIRLYVKTFRNSFVPTHRRYLRNSVPQRLRAFSKTRRRFVVLAKPVWCIVWEGLPNYGTFADPNMARWISANLETRALWAMVNTDYNLWAYQLFENGKCADEYFQPRELFCGKSEDELIRVADKYKSCNHLALRIARKLCISEEDFLDSHYIAAFESGDRAPARFKKAKRVNVRFK